MSNLDLITQLNQDIHQLGNNVQQFADALELITMRLLGAEETINELVEAVQQYQQGFVDLKNTVERHSDEIYGEGV